MAYDLRTAGVPVISESSGLSTPTVLPAFGAPETLEALRDAVNELWNRMGVIAAHYQQTEYRYPERHVWEVLEALNIFNLTHGTTLPTARKDGTPLQAGDMHGDYSQPGIPLRPLIYDGEDFVSFLLDIQPGGAMIDSLLSYLLVNLEVINAPNQALVDALRTELVDGATSAMNTFALVEAAIAALQALVEAVSFDSPAFTGVPIAPTAAPGTNTTQLATTAFVRTEVSSLVDSAPGALDTLNELAAALGDDANFAATMTAALAGKQAALAGTKGQLLGFNDAGAAIAVPANCKYVPWFFATDGVTPVTAALQALLDGGGHIILGPGTYVTGPLTVPAGTKLTGVGNRTSILKQASSTGTFIACAESSSVEGIIVDGNFTTETYAGGYLAGHRGLSCVGTDVLDRDNWRVEDCEVRNFGETGIYGKWLTNTNILENWVHRCGYAGVMLLSPLDPVISGNWVENIFPGPSGNENAYGITCTSSGGDRVPSGCKIAGNTVKDVPTWEGIDIHFGTDSRIENNIVMGCAQGIAYENSIAGSPGRNISIVNNTIIGWAGATTTRDGQTMEKTAGIVATAGAANEFGEGLEIIGNLVYRFGDTRPGGAAAIYARGWKKYQISLNTVRDSFRAAIGLGSGGTAGMEDGIVSLNIIAGVTADNSVARGIDADGQADGDVFGNIITGIPSTGQPIRQASGAKKLRVARERLEAARNLYIRSDGSDTNSGLYDSAGGAVLTAAAAMAIAAAYDTNGYDVVINERRTSITESVQFPNVFGGGRIVYLGNNSSPSSHVISVTAASAVRAENVTGRYSLQGFKLQTTTSGNCVNAVGKGVVLDYGKLDFGACAGHHINADRATLIRNNDYLISGQAATHINALHSADIDNRSFVTTITGTLNFGTAFVRALRNAYVGMHGGTIDISGATVTGKRFDAQAGAVIYVDGGGDTYLPGSVAGTTASGGTYA